jgi:hypothetical protein
MSYVVPLGAGFPSFNITQADLQKAGSQVQSLANQAASLVQQKPQQQQQQQAPGTPDAPFSMPADGLPGWAIPAGLAVAAGLYFMSQKKGK